MTKLRWISGHLEEVLGATLLAAMACLAFANVIARYILHLPLAFTEELEVNGLVWLTLLGTAVAFRRRRHLRLLFFQERLPASVPCWLNIALFLLAAALFASLGYLGFRQLSDERLLGITSEALNLPQWIYTLSIPVGCGLVILRVAQSIIGEIKGKK